MGSQTCEQMFRKLRSLTTTNWTAINFTLLEMLHKIKRIEFCNEATADLNNSFSFPRSNPKKHTSHKLPDECEIFDMVTKAKSDALRDTAEIGIIINQKTSKEVSLCCQLSSIVMKSDERETSEDELFEDEDIYPSDDDVEDESDTDEEETQDEERHQEEVPEDISAILQAHGGSINLKEFTTVTGKTFLLIF